MSQTRQTTVQYGAEPTQCEDRAALVQLLRGSLVLDAFSALAGLAPSIAILRFFGDRMGIPRSLEGDTLILASVQLVMILYQTTLRAENPGIVRFAFSTNASATLGLSRKQIPLLLVGASIGPAAAGAFRVAAQVAQALAKLSQLLSRAVFPEMVRAVRTTEREAITRMMGRMFVGSICAAVVILALVALVGRPVLGLIGGRTFEGAYPVLLWMAGAGCLDLAMVGADTMLTALRRAGTVFAIRAVGAVLLLAAAVGLLSVYGATGVAIGVFIGSTAVAAMFAATVLGMARRR